MREGRVVIALRGIVKCTTGRPARVERRITHSLTGLAVRGTAYHKGSTGDWPHESVEPFFNPWPNFRPA